MFILFSSALSSCEAPPKLEQLWELHDALHKQVIEELKKPWGRADGFTYTVDVGHLLIYAAIRKDKELYTQMRDFAVRSLIQNDPNDAYTKGFVLWRYKQGVTADASGTTEALRIAEGLWKGSQAFKDPTDRTLAILIVEGYTRHAFVDQGIWLIRNYFNLQTRSFVTNSFLVDYDPDFVTQVAQSTQSKELRDMAQRSVDLVRKAVTPVGLLYSMIQPEVATLLPKDLAFFSPNDTIKLFNASTVAERIVQTLPKVAQKVLDFALSRSDDLHQYYLGRSGIRAREAPVGVITYTSLIRLAIHLKRSDAVERFLPDFLEHAGIYKDNLYAPKLYTAGEILLTLQALRAHYNSK